MADRVVIEVTAEMLGPVAFSKIHGLPFDGMLYFAWVREIFGAEMVPQEQVDTHLWRRCQELNREGYLPIWRGPLESPDWFYHASYARYKDLGEERVHWNKRFDAGYALDYAEGTLKINEVSGPFKGYHQPLYLVHAPAFEWCVAVQKPRLEEFIQLTRTLTHIGKKRSQGHGHVGKWHFNPAKEDWSLWRPIPISCADQHAAGRLQLLGIRPPYWDVKHRRACLMPE